MQRLAGKNLLRKRLLLPLIRRCTPAGSRSSAHAHAPNPASRLSTAMSAIASRAECVAEPMRGDQARSQRARARRKASSAGFGVPSAVISPQWELIGPGG